MIANHYTAPIWPEQAESRMAELFGFFGKGGEQIPTCVPIAPESVPEPARGLLAHEHHMTVTLERHYDSPVNLTVLETARECKHYARKILLTSAKTGEVVQYGIMRVNLDHCSDAVRAKIIEGKTPLGRILIEHDVLRRIGTHALLKITPNAEIMRHFGMKTPAPVYGRFATIFCNEEPAVDLLEIVKTV